METYEQTMDSVREALALGCSMSEIIWNLEMNENTNQKALDEILHVQKYGY